MKPACRIGARDPRRRNIPALVQSRDLRILVRLVDVGKKRHQHDAEAVRRQDAMELAHGLTIVLDMLEHMRAQEHVHGTIGIRAEFVMSTRSSTSLRIRSALRYSTNRCRLIMRWS